MAAARTDRRLRLRRTGRVRRDIAGRIPAIMPSQQSCSDAPGGKSIYLGPCGFSGARERHVPRVAGAAVVFGPVTQGAFLQNLGIVRRTEQLGTSRKPADLVALVQDVDRLITPRTDGNAVSCQGARRSTRLRTTAAGLLTLASTPVLWQRHAETDRRQSRPRPRHRARILRAERRRARRLFASLNCGPGAKRCP